MSDEEYKPRQKPVLTKEQKVDLSKRNRMSHKRPKFRRQNWFRYKRLGEKWRSCLLYTSPSPRDAHESRMPSSA